MSFTDTANARKYASIAETAAAQAKLYASQLENAPDYAAQAAASAAAAASSAQVATSAEAVVNNLVISASESATSAAASAAEAGNAAAAAIGRSVRAPDGESLSDLPAASERENSVLTFGADGDNEVKPISDFAILDSSGKLPVSVIPSIALTEPFVVSSQAEMLALDAQVGDIAKRTDLGYSFCLASAPATSLSNWVQLTDDVLAQLGQSTGAAAVGATTDTGTPSTVQAVLLLKANKSDLPAISTGIYTALSADNGASLVGGSVYVVPTFSAAKLVTGVKGKQLKTLGYSSVNIGSATYSRDGTTGTPSSGNEYKFYDADGTGWLLNGSSILPSVFGIIGDGSNETTKIQLWLDSCALLKATAWVPYSATLGSVGIVLNGSHDYLRFACEGEFKLVTDGSVAFNTPSNLIGVGACFGMFINGCTGIRGNLRWNGDRATKIASEQIHCIGMFGGYDIELSLNFRECRGDGIYVNHYCGNNTTEITRTPAAQNFPTYIRFPSVVSNNSEIDGRNAVSLIAYKGMHIGSMFSRFHGDGGRVIGYQPGGLDVEPNQYWQSCYDLVVDQLDSVASGSSGGFSLVGKVNASDPEDTNIRGVSGNIKVVTQWYNTAEQHHGVVLGSATDVHLDISSEGYINPTAGVFMYGASISCLKQFYIRLNTKRTSIGAQIGAVNLAGATTAICTNGTLDLQSSHVHLACRAGMLSGVNINVTGGTFVNMGAGDLGILEMKQASINSVFQPTTQVSCRFSANTAGASSFLSLLNFGIRNNISNAVVPTGCIIHDSDLTNVPHNTGSAQDRVAGIAGFRKERILGVTSLSGDTPITGTSIWGAGDIFWNTSNAATFAGKRYSGSAFQNFGSLS